MLTVLAENKNNREVRAIIELPVQDGKISEFRKALSAESDSDIAIRYAGTGELWSTDTLLLENNLRNNPITVQELNLLAHLMGRMDTDQFTQYDSTMSGYTNDLGTAGIKSLINEAYETLHGEDAPVWYKNDNIDECISFEKTLLKLYPEMDKDVFWQMISDAREQSGGDTDAMQQSLTDTLSRMNPKEIVLFKDIHDEYIRMADTAEVYEASKTLIGHGLGDDGFTDFRAYLISHGKDVYMSVVNNPDCITELNLKPIDGYYEWESFAYIAPKAYEQDTGEDLYDQPHAITPGDKGEIYAEKESCAFEDQDTDIGMSMQ